VLVASLMVQAFVTPLKEFSIKQNGFMEPY